MINKIPITIIFIMLFFQFLLSGYNYSEIKEIHLNENLTELSECKCNVEIYEEQNVEKENIEIENFSEELKENAYIIVPHHSHSESDIDILAKLVWIEARGESDIGQQAVAEVVMNRVKHHAFPNTINEVIFQKGQFTDAAKISYVSATEKEYKNVKMVLNAETDILSDEVVYFSTAPQNNKIYKIIGNHYFNKY